MSAYHGAMLYDTLFGIDANLDTRPQMVVEVGHSPTTRKPGPSELRDGLKFRDGLGRYHRRRHRFAAAAGPPATAPAST